MIEVDTFEHAGLTIRIGAEEYVGDNDNPRKNCDGNIGVMFCEHPSYDLGDDDAEDPRGHSAKCEACGGSGETERWSVGKHYEAEKLAEFDDEDAAAAFLAQLVGVETGRYYIEPIACGACEGEGEIDLSLTDYLKSIGCRVALPLFLYDHSGITMSCGGNLLAGEDNFARQGRFTGDGAGWDTSSVGLIYHSPELCERWGRPETDDAQIENELREEVQTYATYLEGGIYYYQVLDGEEALDSCGGFLDGDIWKDDCYTKQEARQAAEACREQLTRERAEAYEMACRDIATIGA